MEIKHHRWSRAVSESRDPGTDRCHRHFLHATATHTAPPQSRHSEERWPASCAYIMRSSASQKKNDEFRVCEGPERFCCRPRILLSSCNMHSYIRPHQHVALRLPSDTTKIVKVVPNTYVLLSSAHEPFLLLLVLLTP